MGGKKGRCKKSGCSLFHHTLSFSLTAEMIPTTILSSILTVTSSLARLVFYPSHLTRYADYLRDVYAKSPVAIDTKKWPPTPSTTYIGLTLIKKEKVSREEANYFLRLTLQGNVKKILQAKQPITIEEVLKDSDTHVVVVEGAPGIGKSTLAWELCRQWSTLKSLKRFSLVLFLRLREEKVQAATAISDLLYHRDKELCRCVGEEVERMEGKGVLLVFDGYDELSHNLHQRSLVTSVINGDYLPKATVVVTSRPSAIAQLLSEFQAHVDKHIEVVGFSEKNIQEYAKSILGSRPELLKNFLTYLSGNPVVRGMMYNPLNCGMVVEVYRETYLSHRPFPHTQTHLYTELSLCFLSPHLKEAALPTDVHKLEDIPHDLYQQLVELGQLAFERRVKNEITFTGLPESCSALGLLYRYSELCGLRENVVYIFLHLTMQEYLGAFYISQQHPTSKQKNLFVEHRELGHLNVVWRFVAGLTRMDAIGWEEFKERKIAHEDCENADSGYVEGNGVVSVWPSVVQCLYEAQDPRSCAIVFSQSRVEYNGQWYSTPFDAYAVGYCISLCSKDWIVDLSWNGLGPEVVKMLMCGLNSRSVQFGDGPMQYVGGSVEELRLSYNSINVEGLEYLRRFPNECLQQIRTLTLSHCDLGQAEFDLLADTLPFLSSLKSLDISHNPGGNRSAIKLLQELGTRQKVEHLDMENTAIGRDDIMALNEVVQPSGNLRVLTIGSHQGMSLECLQQLLKRLLVPSSLIKLKVWVPSSASPLAYIETISDNLTSLGLWSEDASHEHLATELSCSRILKDNKTLKVLMLIIPLEDNELRAIAKSLEDNHTLATLWLCEAYHCKYFSKAAKKALDHRIKWMEF